MSQLRSTVAMLASRPEVPVPESLRAMVARAEGGRAEALTAELPHLYALANALDADAADDLVQETLTFALANPDAVTTGPGLVAALLRLADERRPDVESPAVPTAGSDPDADEAELFYPDFYTDGPDAGAWVDFNLHYADQATVDTDRDVRHRVVGMTDQALAHHSYRLMRPGDRETRCRMTARSVDLPPARCRAPAVRSARLRRKCSFLRGRFDAPRDFEHVDAA
jgi:hypothetical protein